MSAVQKFRKRPVVIEAILWTGKVDPELPREWYDFLIQCAFLPSSEASTRCTTIVIKTLEGDMLAAPGTWIVRGTSGEFYPVQAKIFEEMYEKVLG